MSAVDPALDPAIDHRIRAFLKELNSAGGQPINVGYVSGGLHKLAEHLAQAYYHLPVESAEGPGDTHLRRAALIVGVWAVFLGAHSRGPRCRAVIPPSRGRFPSPPSSRCCCLASSRRPLSSSQLHESSLPCGNGGGSQPLASIVNSSTSHHLGRTLVGVSSSGRNSDAVRISS